MALVEAHQTFVVEGYSEIKEKTHLFARTQYVRKPIKVLTGVTCICDETEAVAVIEEKIKEEMKQLRGWGNNFEGWSSYRKYCNPGEYKDFPNGKEFNLDIEYIRNWKMEKIIKELDAIQFATLCNELGIGAEEALKIQ